jgi:RNA-directed DNA polymerase
MTKAPIGLQDLRRKLYVKAKAEPSWRFWGMFVHVCKLDTLRAAYEMAKQNNGAPGIDGVTFAVIEAQGVMDFLLQIQNELKQRTYEPQPLRKKEIPKDGGSKVRVLSIPTIRDRVVQGALKLIMEPVFEADFQSGSYGYRPKRTAHQAVQRVMQGILLGKLDVIDLDLRAYFDSVRHDRLLEKVAKRIQDNDMMALLKKILKSSGSVGVPQGGVISPLLSNIYLNEIDQMLERASKVTQRGRFRYVEYARFADDLVVLIDSCYGLPGLHGKVLRRLREEFGRLGVEINEEKSKCIDLRKGESFGFLGFDFRRIRARTGNWRVKFTPKLKKRTALLQKLKEVFRRYKSQPVERVIDIINPILRGWVNYFSVGHSSKCFRFVQRWVELKVRRHMMRARNRRGFGWQVWSTQWLYEQLGLFNSYRLRRFMPKAQPA